MNILKLLLHIILKLTNHMKNIYHYLPFILGFLFVSIINSQSLDATLLELKFSNDGYPEKMTKADNGFYFSSEDDQLWFSNGTTENTYMVKDFDSGFYDEISNIIPFGNSIFFTAHNGNDNRELWISDGTEEGTIQLTDRNVGFGTEDIYNIIIYKGNAYFGAYDETYGYELWISDGTQDGTKIFKDIAENEISSSPRDFFIFNDKLFFKAYTEATNTELWVSDGTENGTILLKDINPGSSGGMSNTQGYITFNQNFYFFANNGTQGYELWKSDGTTEGTQLVKDIRSGIYDSNRYFISAVLNNKIVFLADDGINGNELWLSDGTSEGTELLTDLNSGYGNGVANTGVFKLVGEKIFFYGSNGTDQTGLWVTNGTETGTTFINTATPNMLTSDSSNTYVFYYAYNNNNGNVLWKSDGTVNGTQIISEVSATNSSIMDDNFLLFNDQIFFSGKTEVNGTELWVTDGTSEGTNLFFDLNHTYGVNPSQLTTIGDRLFFRGNQYGNFGLCTTDGTIEGTKYLDINPDGQSIDEDSEFGMFNGQLVMSANDGIHGYELWISDGTQEGTRMIKDIYPGDDGSMNDYQNFTTIENKIYFSANDGIHGYELWTSDGTESGTHMIKDLRTGGNNYSGFPSNFVSYNGYVYFSSFGSLWRTDGTNQGTISIVSLNGLREIKVVNNKLLMIAETSGTTYGPHDLWVSDGTSGGTEHIQSFGDGIDSSIRFMTILNDELYFVARNPDNARKSIYKSDGTFEGTKLVYDGNTHPEPNIDIDDILTCGEYVYFAVQYELSSNKELWRTDGTQEGTHKIAGQENGNYPYYREMTCQNNNLFYLAESLAKNVWVTNGQLEEPIPLSFEVINGPNFIEYDNIGYMAASENKLYFEARNDISGSEIYVTTPIFDILNVEENISDIVENQLKAIVYPNPSNGIINIRTSNRNLIKSFDIYDISGKKLMSETNKKSTQSIEFNVASLLSGIYIINIDVVGSDRVTTKLIIK